MVAYNFADRFAGAVESGEKTRTIRKARAGKSRHARPGEIVQLYTGMRTADCRKLGEGLCTLSTYCAIREDGITLGNHPPVRELDFAQADGFRDFEDMKAWFRDHYGLPFIGQLICWMPVPTPDGER